MINTSPNMSTAEKIETGALEDAGDAQRANLKHFDLLKPVKETGKFLKDLFYYKDCLTQKEGERAHHLPPSVQKHMRLKEYDANNKLFLMDDGKSYASLFEVRGFPTEGRDEAMLQEYASRIQNLITKIKTYSSKDSPFIVQCYISDQPNIYSWYERLKEYVAEPAKDTKLRQIYLAMARSHINFASQEGGMFVDENTQEGFRGCERTTFLLIYRKIPPSFKGDALKEALVTARNIESSLNASRSYGVTFKRCDDADLYKMLFTLFHKRIEGFSDISDFFEAKPYIRDIKQRPYGYHFLEQSFRTPVKSYDDGYWKIGQTYHKYLTCLGLTRGAKTGEISAELPSGDKVFEAFFDKMPEGATLQITFVCQSKADIVKEITTKEKSANKSNSADAFLTREEAAYWLLEVENGNLLYPTSIGCYVSATSLEELDDRYNSAKNVLGNGAFEVLDEEYDVYKLDKFLRFLPGNYDAHFERYYFASRLLPINQLARLLPIGYCREKGSGNPLLWGMNRGAEMVGVDPIVDIESSPHLLLLGKTGMGKSVSAGAMMLSLMATHNPFLTVVDAGGSFEFLMKFFKAVGLNVKRYEIKSLKGDALPDFSLAPYANLKEMLDQVAQQERIRDMADQSISVAETQAKLFNKELESLDSEAEREAFANQFKIKHDDKIKDGDNSQTGKDNNKAAEEAEQAPIQRNYIGEFLTSTLIMVCGDKSQQQAGISDQHRSDLLSSIIECAKAIDSKGGKFMLPSQLHKYINQKVSELEKSSMQHEINRANRLREMAERLDLFLKDGVNALYFNRPSIEEEQADITYFEMGLWKDDHDSNKAPRALAFVTLMNQTLAQAQARKKTNSKRFSVFFGDECHVVTTQQATAACLTQSAKMARKEGLVLIFATQNIEDFPDSAAKILTMFEFWMCLGMGKSEFEKVTKHIEVSDLERNLFQSIKNQKRAFSEMVVLSNKYHLLMRTIPFREMLFLLKNNPDEYKARMGVAQEYGINEVQAGLLQAQIAKGYSPKEAMSIVAEILS